MFVKSAFLKQIRFEELVGSNLDRFGAKRSKMGTNMDAKSIKKTLKTEAKAIAYGTERVDKRGKPVTSIADRTNVRCVILI